MSTAVQKSIAISELKTEEEWSEAYGVLKYLHTDLELEKFLGQMLELSKKEYFLIGLRQEGKLISVAGIQTIELLSLGKIYWIFDMVTLPKHRSKGFGRAVLDHVHNLADQTGCSRVLLHTANSRKETIQFYDKYFESSFGQVYRSVI